MQPQTGANDLGIPSVLDGPSRFCRDLRGRLNSLANSRLPLLIEGEIGVGKSDLAREIHRASPRRQRPFQILDCNALPGEILSRELFGHRRGAFTGADHDAPGLLRAADGGTLFLGEVEELNPSAQKAILRVLQEREIHPLGAPSPEPIDLRFIESSRESLANRVRKGHFRTDLFYRLNGLSIEIPPLRQRPEDLAFLLEHTLRRLCRELKRPLPRLREDLRSLLIHDPWPGNSLELVHTLEHLLVVGDENLLTPHHLPAALLQRMEDRSQRDLGTRTFSLPAEAPFDDQVAAFQRILIQRVHNEVDRDLGELCRRLGLSRGRLRSRCRSLGIDLGGPANASK